MRGGYQGRYVLRFRVDGHFTAGAQDEASVVPHELDQLPAVGFHLLLLAESEHGRAHVALDAQVIGQDLPGLADVSAAVELDDAACSRKLLEARDHQVPVAVAVEY